MQFLGFWRNEHAPRAKAGSLRAAALAVLTALLIGAFSGVVEAAPKFAALTVDARNGKLLYAEDPDGIRHPASLTKMMTLYLLFEDLKSGRLKLDSPIRMSKRAASMAPSKLGIKPGTTISVETAIRALVVKSANDVAAAVAENLGGTEVEFARRMTRTARAIGMKNSNFANASGLPNPAQITTARDMATLGLRLMRDFPQYYPYFRTRSFVYGGRTINGHNRLLGKFEGTDGIKTGYVAASGFNLVTSVRRGDKRLVGVVLGGRSGGSRDAYMKQMLTKQFGSAQNGKMIAAFAGSSKGAIDPVEVAEASPQAAESGTIDGKIKKPKGSLFGKKKQDGAAARDTAVAEAEAVLTPEQGDADDEETAADTSQPAVSMKQVEAEQLIPENEMVPAAPQVIESELVDPSLPAKLPFQVKTPSDQLADVATVASIPADTSWSIHLGDFATKKDAQARLQVLRKKSAAILDGKTAETMMIQKGEVVSYRARFSGFDEAAAKAACKQIKKSQGACTVQAPA